MSCPIPGSVAQRSRSDMSALIVMSGPELQHLLMYFKQKTLHKCVSH